MCGIAGCLLNVPAEDRGVLHAMRESMRHRGPDDAGTWWSADGRVGLAHRRLAVLDLSPGGRQPMRSAAGGLVVVLNGEIYNHGDLRRELEAKGRSFRSTSDTEVLLEAWDEWGDACLPRLDGMFAFAMWEERTRRLVLARDRAGEKPLFLHEGPRGLAFASEVKGLLADPRVPRTLDPDALAAYLAFGYVPSGRCLLREIRKLPPAHTLTLEGGRAPVMRAWWALPAPASGPPPDVADLERELETLLENAVRRQMAADVPVGVLLSGGVDSSLVTALAARSSERRVRTFTVTFPGHPRHDESAFARVVADRFGTEHHELVAGPASVDLLPELARQYDDPIADSSVVPTFLVTRLVREHATVALGGDGGDELFGGYDQHVRGPNDERMRRWLPRPLRRAAAAVARGLPDVRGRRFLAGFLADAPESLAGANLYFDEAARIRLLGADVREALTASPEAEKARLWNPAATVLQNATRMDFRTYLPDDVLAKVDRASMLNSLEVRAPFLDRHVVEFAFGRVPDVLRAANGERKILLRRLAARLLPSELDLDRKHGFSPPLDAWLRDSWAGVFAAVLTDAPAGILRPEAVRSLLAPPRRGTSNASRLFALTMFELWRREYRVAAP